MDNINWVFDGIGTEIISLIIGAIVGGGIGYKVGVKNKMKHTQNAGKSATQIQIKSSKNISIIGDDKK